MQRNRLSTIGRISGLAVLLAAGTVGAALAADPSHVSFTLEGCRNDGTITLPNGSGDFICPDSAYTTGNLGKGWNELDLVPHRLTADAGNAAPATQTYSVSVVLDNFDAGHPGYDVISPPALNTALSDAGCTPPLVGSQLPKTPGLGGIDTSIYRLVTITQAKNKKCVYDFYGRLALGSHLFPGSSLHANLADENVSTAGIGARDVSIPVKEIQPQELREDMSATQGTDHVWSLSKTPTPANAPFGDTCRSPDPQSLAVKICVKWEKLAATPSGAVMIIAHVYAKNPAARTVTVNATDKVYAGLTQTNLLDTANSGDIDIPANTELLVLTHTFTWDPTTDTNVNAVATATYTDKVTGIPIPGQTTATASAAVQLTGPESDATATIKDVETISETPACEEGEGPSCTLEFSADSFSGASGGFDNYSPGTKTFGPVSWNSDTQSAGATVCFQKTVYVPGPTRLSGTLHDDATLTGSNDATASAFANVGITAQAFVSLTITKTIPDILTGQEEATFTFHVRNSQDVEVATPVLTFLAGATSKSVIVNNLDPDTYKVSEDVPLGWKLQFEQEADLNLPTCSTTVPFANDFKPAKAQVTKVTAPPGFEANWPFDLKDGGGNVLEMKSTGGAAFIDFATVLEEGSYSIVEHEQDGWTNNGGTSDCSFTVDYPADADKTFSCQFTNTFQPSITLDKTGPALSKIGDSVTYTIKLKNTSPTGGAAGAPSLECDINDATIGFSKTVTLASGASDTSTVPFIIPPLASDPFVNTATAECHYASAEDVVASASDSHSINLFQPAITFDKSADTQLSKVGHVVNYKLTLNNTSSADSPSLVCTITDAKLAVNKNVTLASGASDVTNVAYTVQAGDPDPLVNTASVSCSPTSFPNVLTASGSWTVNLFQPSVKVTKTGPAFSKAGDTATYNVTIQNTSSADSPDLVLDSFSDSVAVGVTPAAACNNLASGASCSFSYTYVVQATDSDPLVNTATAHYHPTGFANDITKSSSWTTDLLHPSFTVTKLCKAEPVSQAGPAVFTITFMNTGDADLQVVPSEGAPFDVPAGQTSSYDYSISGPFSASVPNTVTGIVILASKYGLLNSYPFTATDSCDVKGKVNIIKTVSGQPPAAGQTFTFQIRQGASTGNEGLPPVEQQDTDANGNISFTTELAPGSTYQICEFVFAGWNTNLTGDGPLFVPNSIIPPSLPNPNVNNLTVCADFTVTSGQTRTFNVDNTPPPGGRALTIGFWKNWASCSSSSGKQKSVLDLALGYASATTTNPPGGLVVSAQNAGSGWPNYASLWYLVLKGDPTSTKDNIKNAPDCSKAVNLLDKRTTSGTKKASDPLFNMTAQLMAAELNRFMGAGINGTTITNIDRAVLLNGKYVFNGLTHNFLNAADTSLANCLATQLDNYNNNNAVSACP